MGSRKTLWRVWTTLLLGMGCMAAIACTLNSQDLASSSTMTTSDTYGCYRAGQCDHALASSQHCQAGRDYTITSSQQFKTNVVVLSIHGGKIELKTSHISHALAKRYQWNRYDFAGHGTAQCLSGRRNFDVLHVTSSKFDEPQALKLVRAHPKAVSIHGYGNHNGYPPGTICVGGRNATQIAEFIRHIENNQESFSAYTLIPVDARHLKPGDVCAGLGGTAPRNIVNQTSTGMGLQLELSAQMRNDLTNRQSPQTAELQDIVYGAIYQALSL